MSELNARVGRTYPYGARHRFPISWRWIDYRTAYPQTHRLVSRILMGRA